MTADPAGALDLIATTDLAGICRGRAVPAGTASSVGWVPANLAINAFATLADNPFGSVGDLRIHADPATAVPLPSPGALSVKRAELAEVAQLSRDDLYGHYAHAN